MRTSNLLPEECKAEIRTELAQNGPEKPYLTERAAIMYREGWLDALEWVINDKEG